MIDFKAVKKDQVTVLLDAIRAYFSALQDGYVPVEPSREGEQAEALRGNTRKNLWKLLKKLLQRLRGRSECFRFPGRAAGADLGSVLAVQLM